MMTLLVLGSLCAVAGILIILLKLPLTIIYCVSLVALRAPIVSESRQPGLAYDLFTLPGRELTNASAGLTGLDWPWSAVLIIVILIVFDFVLTRALGMRRRR